MIPRDELATTIRAGIRQGRIETRLTLTTLGDLLGYLIPTAGLLTVLVFQRGHKVAGTGFSLGAVTLPSVIGAGFALAGLMTFSLKLAEERTDGTLLRAKAMPHGMTGYLIGKSITVAAGSAIGFVLTLVPGLFLLPDVSLRTPAAWLTLVAVAVLSLLATIPIGAVIGSVFSDPSWTGITILPGFGLIAISGMFYPITHFPVWLQDIAQVFPLYWAGLGMRSALLPAHAAAVEIGGSWRHLATFAVLGAWAVAGMLLAPWVLRRMARKESGSSMEMRKAKAFARAR
ncbi:MAG TPA: ABC transporter permease [Pseudonocardiaceae bacterium]|jgi:ABC-2 type transport system permease protein|nr:ABC transporter permease [Pseudonocardiaceae bacterium]